MKEKILPPCLILGIAIALSCCGPCEELERRCDNCETVAEADACRAAVELDDPEACEAAMDVYRCE